MLSSRKNGKVRPVAFATFDYLGQLGHLDISIHTNCIFIFFLKPAFAPHEGFGPFALTLTII